MLPYWNLGGTLFPTYSLLTLLGAAAAWLYFHRQLKARGENPGRTEQAFLFGVLGALVGAKFLYLLLQLPQLLQDLPLLAADPGRLFRPLPLGWVRLLWRLFGALAAVWLFCRRRKVPFSQLGPTWSPPSPCFTPLAGWLLPGRVLLRHSRPRRLAGVTFRVSPVAPNGVALLPVQLYEAAGCLLLFLLLHRLARRGWKGEVLLLVYLAIYALFRFALEFLRGDAAPGDVGGIFHLSAAGSGYSGRCPPPPDPPSPYVRQTAAPVTHRPPAVFRFRSPASSSSGTGVLEQAFKIVRGEKIPERLHPRGNLLDGHRLLLQKPAGQLLAYIRGVVDVVAVLVRS